MKLSRKSVWTISLLVVIILGFAVYVYKSNSAKPASQVALNNDGLTQYTDPSFGYTLKYPRGYTLDHRESAWTEISTVAQDPGCDSRSSCIPAYVKLILWVRTKPYTGTLEEAYKATDMYEAGGITLGSQNETTIGHLPAVKILYCETVSDKPICDLSPDYIVIHNNYLYEFSTFASSGNDADQILQTVAFK